MFGSYFRNLRIEKGMTQSEIAEVIGKKKMLVSGVESGKNGSFTENDLIKISEAMNLSESEEVMLLRMAAKSRNTIPNNFVRYIYQHEKILDLIELLMKNEINDKQLQLIISCCTENINEMHEVKSV